MKTLTLATDNELIRLFQSGSNEALEALVYRHKDKLFTSILMLVKDRYVAEDLFQKVFFQIIDLFKSNSYNEEVGFLSWATRIAYDLCVDHCENVKHPLTMTVAANGNILEVDNSIEESTESGVFQEQVQGEIGSSCNGALGILFGWRPVIAWKVSKVSLCSGSMGLQCAGALMPGVRFLPQRL